ncbi:MAG: flagellar hook-basal body complex protein FliE [Clostridia bacterium]|nr:flagellar hook-basal body complex protein FliE [Clostridia bacterium]MDD4048296.1 flagellar hook-basal body complex protein FliE [Clostridia bacterium]
MDIKSIDSIITNDQVQKSNVRKESVSTFSGILKDALNEVNASQTQAEQLISDFAIGNDVELHQVVIATEKASLALELTMSIKNKVVEAYQEIMRMQV